MLLSLVVIVGALKMKRLKPYGFVVTSAIVAIAICPCDCTSWPLGMAFVWALVVLQDAKVKAEFHMTDSRAVERNAGISREVQERHGNNAFA